jgi:hypothetical protein
MKKLILLLLIVLAGCQSNSISPEEQLSEGDYLIFGTFYGMCVGKCFEAYRLDASGIYVDVGVDNREFYSNELNYEWQKLSKEKFEAIKNLYQSFPNELLADNTSVFGSPDAHDQGGWYIEIIDNGEKKSWRIDMVDERLPSYLLPFVSELRKAVTVLRDK